MTEQKQDQSGHTQTNGQDKGDDKDQMVPLKAEVYNQLLDRLDELEAEVEAHKKGGKKAEGDDLDTLYEEGTRSEGEQTGQAQRELNLDNLSQSELAGHIERELINNALNPILVRMASMELRMEIDDVKRREGFEDFEDHRSGILKRIHNNPKLSIEEAYRLEVGAKPKKSEDENNKGGEPKKKDLLKHLPERPAIHGEKPTGAASSTTRDARPKDTRSAVKMAIKDLNVKFPVSDEDQV